MSNIGTLRNDIDKLVNQFAEPLLKVRDLADEVIALQQSSNEIDALILEKRTIVEELEKQRAFSERKVVEAKDEAKQIVADAKVDAEKVKAEAKVEADRIRADIKAEKLKADDDLGAKNAKVVELRNEEIRLRGLIETSKAELAKAEAAVADQKAALEKAAKNLG